MKLYYTPGACSLASRISLHEARLAADFVKVDLRTKTTEDGDDFRAINLKGYVPLLVLDDGTAISENVAILAFIAEREPGLGPSGPMARTRLIEMLAYLSAELHVAFKPLWHDAREADADAAREAVARRIEYLGQQIAEFYLFGPSFTVADAYLFVMMRWARAFDVRLSAHLRSYFDRVAERPAVARALAEEGLVEEEVEAELAPLPAE